jgi:3-oxoacyl-[acyl-carrier-protein] synthase II
MQRALRHAELAPEDVDILNLHATGTQAGDIQECEAVRTVFGAAANGRLNVNNTKSFIGHAMGAAGALEMAGNLPSLTDGWVHPTINVDDLDPQCDIPGLVLDEPVQAPDLRVVMNNSFGMLGINSALIVKRFDSAESRR